MLLFKILLLTHNNKNKTFFKNLSSWSQSPFKNCLKDVKTHPWEDLFLPPENKYFENLIYPVLSNGIF